MTTTTRPGSGVQYQEPVARKVRAVAYIRVSTQEQAADDRMSLVIQEYDIRAYCERKGYELVRVYRDGGYTGSSRNRPAFKELLRDVPSDQFDVIVCWRGDRIVRGLRPTVALKDALEGTDIEIEATNDYINRRWLSLRAAMAEEELEGIRERTRMGARGRAIKGQLHGPHTLYGYTAGPDGKPVVVEREAEIIRRIYSLYLSGVAIRKIVNLLNSEGLETRRGRWGDASVWNILEHPAYIGQGRFGRRQYYTKDNGLGADVRLLKIRPQDQWVTIPFPAIIDEDSYREAARRRRSRFLRRARQPGVEYPLHGLLWCQFHNKAYTTQYGGNGQGNHYRYYNCICGNRGYRDIGRCQHLRYNADKLEERVVDWVIGWLTDEHRFQEVRDNYEARLRASGGMERLERYRVKLEALEGERARVVNVFQKGYISEEELDLKLRGIREEREYNEEELSQVETEIGGLAATVEMLDHLSDEVKDNKILDHLLQIGLKNVAARVLKRITVTDRPYPNELEFVVNLTAVASVIESPWLLEYQRNKSPLSLYEAEPALILLQI